MKGARFLERVDGWWLGNDAQSFWQTVVFCVVANGVPLCSGVFLERDLALTAYHVMRPPVGSIFFGRSVHPKASEADKWIFVVVGLDMDNDLALLRRHSGPRPKHSLPLSASKDGARALAYDAAALAVLSSGIAQHSFTFGAWFHTNLTPCCYYVRPEASNGRHCAYYLVQDPMDAGSALVNLDGELVGMHVGNWDSCLSPLPSFTATRKTAGAQRDRQRIMAMGLDCVSGNTLHSVVGLARELERKHEIDTICCTGGFAVFVTKAMVDAMLRSCP